MRWWYLTFFIALVIKYGSAATTPTPDVKSNLTYSNVQLVIKFPTMTDNGYLRQTLHINPTCTVAVLNDSDTKSTQINAPFWNTTFNLTAKEVTSALNKITVSTLNATLYNETLYNESSKVILLVDICAASKNVTKDILTDTLDYVQGFLVDLANQPNNTNTSFIPYLVKAGNLSQNGSYIITFEDANVTASKYQTLKQKLCGGARSSRNKTTIPPTNTTNTTIAPLSPCSNGTGNDTECKNVTVPATPITTTAKPSPGSKNTTNSTEGIFDKAKNAFAAHSSGASVALGIIIVLLILIIVGIVFRRKIRHYVRFKLMRPGMVDLEQPSTVRYQNLTRDDEF